MRYAKSRFAGAILLLLGAALILTGIFAAHSSQPSPTPMPPARRSTPPMPPSWRPTTR